MIAVQNHKGNPVVQQDLGLWQGDIVTLLPDCPSPSLSWKGAPIPASFFNQMLGFFRHVYKTWGSEAMVRLAYNKAKSEWRMVCYPQTIKQGMEIKEIKELTDEQKVIRDRMITCLNEGFMENGSSHSHCDMSAFQSGTDLANELKNTGVHITLGNINSDRPSVHGRVSFRGIMYPINWAEWFEGWPADVDSMSSSFSLIPGNDLSFPTEWLECCFEPPVVVAPVYNNWSNYYSREISSRNGKRESYWDDFGDYDDDYSGFFGNTKSANKQLVLPSLDNTKYNMTLLPTRIETSRDMDELTEYIVDLVVPDYEHVPEYILFGCVRSTLSSNYGEAQKLTDQLNRMKAAGKIATVDDLDCLHEAFYQAEMASQFIEEIESSRIDVDLFIKLLEDTAYSTGVSKPVS